MCLSVWLQLLSCLVVSDSVQPQRQQTTGLPCPWDFPGKNTGVGCHFHLQCMKGKSASEVVQWCPTLSDPVDCSLPGSSAHGIFQARVLERGAIAFSPLFPRQHNSPKRKEGNERVTGRKARGLQMEEIACKCQIFLSLKQQEETN